MDAITMLTDDHRRVEALFVQYEGEADPLVRRRLVEQITDELTLHADLEETHFYPVARTATLGTEKLTADGYEEHAKMRLLVDRLVRTRPDDEGRGAAMQSLRALVQSHVEEEEGDLFPEVGEALGSLRLEEIGEAMEDHRRASTPRR